MSFLNNITLSFLKQSFVKNKTRQSSALKIHDIWLYLDFEIGKKQPQKNSTVSWERFPKFEAISCLRKIQIEHTHKIYVLRFPLVFSYFEI